MAVSLLVVSDREPLAWLLTQQRWAVPAARARSVPEIGDDLLVYTTRGCYRNPGRDRGVVMGRARVLTSAADLAEPASFRGRKFPTGFDVRIVGLAALHDGVELGPMAGTLDFLPDAANWSVRLRRSLITLSESDATRLAAALRPHLRPPDDVVDDYVRAAKLPGASAC